MSHRSPGVYIDTWGRQIKAAMILKNINNTELSRMVGKSRPYMSSIINGRMIPSEELAKQISTILDIPNLEEPTPTIKD